MNPVPWFNAYDPSWVDKLYRGFARNLSEPFRFICLVDDDYAFDEPVEAVRFERPDLSFMALNEIFRPDLGIDRGLFVGLDTVIVGSLDGMVAHEHSLSMPRDPFNPRKLCNAVVLFSESEARRIWKIYQQDVDGWAQRCRIGQHIRRGGYPSEFIFLQQVLPNGPRAWLDDLYPGQILSFKQHLAKVKRAPQTDSQTRQYLDQCGLTSLPNEARIVYFHGRPKPHDLSDAWMQEHWR